MRMHHECFINACRKLSNRVGSPWLSQGSWSKINRTLGASGIYNQFTRTTTIDEIINANASKCTMEGQKLTRTLTDNAIQTHNRSPSLIRIPAIHLWHCANDTYTNGSFHVGRQFLHHCGWWISSYFTVTLLQLCVQGLLRFSLHVATLWMSCLFSSPLF